MAGPRAAPSQVAVVTGGGRGIGAAIAEELGRTGAFVVTLDPLVTLDGAAATDDTDEPTTAERIVAAGGAARASSVSVTDRPALEELFSALVEEFGNLDAVVNVAGISRPTSFASGTEDDWRSVVAVHLDGYRNVLHAALPHMAAAGHGRILGVTSGSGWRQADAGAYGCAKRAVASLTWQLARHAPPGVVVNALSPIALTRMVTAALGRSGDRGSRPAPSGGIALAGFPTPDELGPIGAHLVGRHLDWCNGRVIFAAGSELAVIEPPRLLEVVRSTDAASLAHVLDTVAAAALVPAEDRQATTGGATPRMGPVFDEAASEAPASPAASTCAVVVDDPTLAAAATAALTARGCTTVTIDPGPGPVDVTAAAGTLASATDGLGSLDAVVVRAGGPAPATGTGWHRVLAEHDEVGAGICSDAALARAAADLAAGAGRAVRLVTLTDATTTGGRSRAQAAAQLARAAQGATDGLVTAFPVSVESPDPDDAVVAAELAAHLVAGHDAPALSGAELVVGAGWFGVRSHPSAATSITYGGPAVPAWLDEPLRAAIGGPEPQGEHR